MFQALTALITAYASINDTQALEIYMVFRYRLKPDIILSNALLKAHCNTTHIDQARRMFERIQNKDVISYNIMIDGYLKQETVEKGKQLFHQMD
jgi:pentatricopeptide repeat protein